MGFKSCIAAAFVAFLNFNFAYAASCMYKVSVPGYDSDEKFIHAALGSFWIGGRTHATCPFEYRGPNAIRYSCEQTIGECSQLKLKIENKPRWFQGTGLNVDGSFFFTGLLRLNSPESDEVPYQSWDPLLHQVQAKIRQLRELNLPADYSDAV